MKRKPILSLARRSTLTFLLVALGLPVFAQPPIVAERVASLKAILMASNIKLRQYQWIETTVINVNGDQKSRKQQMCYYGADGKLTKVLLNQSVPAARKRGLRGLIARRKQKELADYLRKAVALIRQYVPPDQAKLQAAKDAGHVAIQMIDPGKVARLTFSDYVKSGDRLSLDVDLKNNHPLSAKVSSRLDSDQNPVTLAVTFGTLDDGTLYVSSSVLSAPAKKLNVIVQNSGFRKAASPPAAN